MFADGHEGPHRNSEGVRIGPLVPCYRPRTHGSMYEVIHEWLSENMPSALELCPYKAASSVSAGAGQVPADTIEKAQDALNDPDLLHWLGSQDVIGSAADKRTANALHRLRDALAALDAQQT